MSARENVAEDLEQKRVVGVEGPDGAELTHGWAAIAGMMGAFGRRSAHRYRGQKPWRSEWDSGEGAYRHTMDNDVAAVIRRLA